MNVIKKIALTALVASAATSGVASAMCNGTTTCSGKISRLFINQGGILSVRLADTDIPDGTSCTRSSNYATLLPDNPSFKNLYAMALTAQASNGDVSVRIVNNSPSCEIQYIVLDTPQ